MKKKLLAMFLVGCMVLSLAACGNTKADSKKEDVQTEEGTEAADETETPDTSAMGTSTLEELGEYKGLTYVPMDTTVSEDEVEAEVQYMLANSPSKNPQEVVTETSYVNINYVGKKDDVAFEGGTAENQELSIENSGYIPGFAESIVGMKVGETKDCPMTFPEDYKAPELAGADVVFTITVNECWEQIPAELNDEFAKSNNYESVDALYEGIRANYQMMNEQEAQSDAEYQLLQQIITSSSFDINPEEVQLYVDQMMEYHGNLASNYYGVDLETYVANALGVDLETYKAQCEESGTFQIQQTLVKKAIAEAEGLEISDEEYQTGMETYSSYYGYTDVTEFETAIGKEDIVDQLLMDKATAFVFDNAVAEEAE